MSLDDCDKMIKRLLKNEEAVKSFIKSSQTDGVSTKEIQGQLQYFGIKYLLK